MICKSLCAFQVLQPRERADQRAEEAGAEQREGVPGDGGVRVEGGEQGKLFLVDGLTCFLLVFAIVSLDFWAHAYVCVQCCTCVFASFS